MKRVTLLKLRKHDRDNDTSHVREIEMLVDGCLKQQDYAPQFWRDVSLFGVEEAYLYLQNQDATVRDTASLPKVKGRIDQICQEIRAKSS